MIDVALSPEEARLASLTLDRLRRAGFDPAVTGGLAIGWYRSRGGGEAPTMRPLHDLDLVVQDLRSVPDDLGRSFEIRHVHADAPPGRMLVQAFDRSTALRIDVFGAYGDTLSRCLEGSLQGVPLRVVSPEDVVARLASLLLDLALGEPVAPKHADDFRALASRVDPARMAAAWKDHGRSRHPPDFGEARSAVLDLIRGRPDLLRTPDSPYRSSPCPRCRPHAALRPSVSPPGGEPEPWPEHRGRPADDQAKP